MLAFLNKYRAYLLPVLLGILLIAAVAKAPQEDLDTSANKIENFVTDAQNEFDKLASADLPTQEQLIADTKLKVFVFNAQDSLLLYNDNTIAPASDSPTAQPQVQLLTAPHSLAPKKAPKPKAPDATAAKLKNGWYLLLRHKAANGNTVMGYALIKHEYRFENKFLKNEYDVGAKIPANYNITDLKIQGSEPVHSRDGHVLFSLYADDTHIDTNANVALVLIYLLILFIICYYLHEIGHIIAGRRGPHLALLFLATTAIGIRYVMVTMKFPGELYKLDLFNPSLYGSALFAGSLGDLAITCAMLFWLSAFYFSIDERFGLSLFPARYRRAEQLLLIGLQFVGSYSILWLFRSLIMDSVISFEVYNILSLSLYSLLGPPLHRHIAHLPFPF